MSHKYRPDGIIFRMAYFSAIICFILSAGLNVLAKESSELLTARINRYVENGTVMLNDESGRTLVAINPDKQYVPASIIKVLTSLIAQDLLKKDFRFPTEYCLQDDSSLLIKGYGDPFMISDEIRLLAQDIKNRNITSVRRIDFDRSFFSDDLSIPGLSSTGNPYDALNGALVVNFNTVFVGKDARGRIYSAEEETPLTPLAERKARSFSPGFRERINLSSDRMVCNQYAAELVSAVFEEQGIFIGNKVFEEEMLKDYSACHTYYNSHSLNDVLESLLKYSNNFIANQLFLYLGATQKQPPATMEKAMEVFEEYIRNRLNLSEKELVMVEGSGISRANRVTGNAMISVMERFKPQANLLDQKKGHYVKSGTLKNVTNYAGYIRTEKGLRSFVIILNQTKNYRDTILQLLSDCP